MRAWYFSNLDRKLRYEDGRSIKIGATHKHSGKVVLCQSGLHASMRAFDALKWAPGPVLWRVECAGDMVYDFDKLACSERKYIDCGMDISEMLNAYARWCAASVMHLWDCPDIVKSYLLTGDNSIWKSSFDAVFSSSKSAAQYSALAAIQYEAPQDSAWYASRSATRASGCNKTEQFFEKMCESFLIGNTVELETKMYELGLLSFTDFDQ